MTDVVDHEDTVEPEEPETPASRRSMLSKGAIAAAVGATAGLLASSRGMAANGSTMIVGSIETGTNTTGLDGGTSFRVTNGNSTTGGGLGGGGASIFGTQSGTTNGDYGVRGRHTGSQGVGVFGDATGSGGRGVWGRSTGSQGFGVYGEQTGSTVSGVGVYGIAELGVGVVGKGSSVGVRGEGGSSDLLADQSGKVLLGKAASPTPAPSATGAVGTIARDGDGNLWYCYAANLWMKVAGAAVAGAFHAIAPARVYDSRTGFEPAGVVKGKLNPGENRVVDCTFNASGVPLGAKAVVFNLTAANTTGRGFLAAYPDGSPEPATSSINYTPGVNIANSTTSGCGPDAKIRVLCGGSTGADFIVDIVGYYV